jgi:hypothetical protein
MTRRRVLWTAAAVAAVVVAWAVWSSPERAFRAYVAELRAAGEPLDYDGLVGPPVPAEHDGGADLDAASQWLKANVDGERWESVVGPWNTQCDATWPETSTPDQLAELAKFLVEIEPCRDALRRAAAKPRITVRADARDDFGFPTPGVIRRVQEASRVLCAGAVGLPDELARVESTATLLAISSRAECASLIDLMVMAASASSAGMEVRRAAERGLADPVAARARLDPLLREDWLSRLPAALRGDRVWTIRMYQFVLDGGELPHSVPTFFEKVMSYAKTGKAPPSRLFGIESDPPGARDVVAHCEMLTAALRVPVGSYPEFAPSIRAAVSPYVAVVGGAYAEMIGKRSPEMFCRTDAAARLARIALAAAEHRATHGDFPGSLDELKPMFADGVPLDPYTDAPFVYERTETGVRIASAGRLAEEEPLDEETLRERCLVWELKR